MTVKEDCILQDGSDMMEIHIWESLSAQLANNRAYYFKNLTLRYYIQDGDAKLWLTTFTNELVELLKKTTKSLESTEDDIEDALMGSTDIKFKYNCKRNIVQEIGSQ